MNQVASDLLVQPIDAKKKWYRSLGQRAAVSIILQEQDQGLSMLMIQRAESEGDPWSGQMAFPGGKQDESDANITQTALRETHEEIGVHPENLQRTGRLSDILARPYRINQRPMVVSPILFEPQVEMSFTPNHEVADLVWVPLSHFYDDANRQKIAWTKNGVEMQLPCYHYEDKQIWGLSLLMIDEITGKGNRPKI